MALICSSVNPLTATMTVRTIDDGSVGQTCGVPLVYTVSTRPRLSNVDRVSSLDFGIVAHQLVKIGEAADVHTYLYTLVQRCQPPGDRAPHRHPHGREPAGIDIRPRAQVIQGPKAVIDHQAEQRAALPQHLAKCFTFADPM